MPSARCRGSKEGGLLHAGLPCASCTWVSSSIHGRTVDLPLGDKSRPWVIRQNVLASHLMLLILAGLACRVHFFIEHPACSKLPQLLFVKAVLANFSGDDRLGWDAFEIRWLPASSKLFFIWTYDTYHEDC